MEKNDIKILYYEVGYDETNILGSGSTQTIYWTGKSWENALQEYHQPGVNYMERWIKEKGKLRKQWYNPWTKDWEYII